MSELINIKTTPRVIAFYLPQFHPFPENDNWWGKGFTEWTNISKAKALFRGHQQPKVPADLGYYDLRLPIVREQQAALAKESGISGFCYWHYWFGEGKQLMNRIIDEVHASGSPNFPFCLGWANESWKAKQWNKDGGGDKILIEQVYGGELDFRMHFNYVKELFKDERYIRVNNQPLFYIYKPFDSESIAIIITLWNKWIKSENIAEKIYFVANMEFQKDYENLKELGFDAVSVGTLQRMDYGVFMSNSFISRIKYHFRDIFKKGPVVIDYKKTLKYAWNQEFDSKEDVLPFLIPNWDHTPRSGKKGRVFKNCTPENFKEQARRVINGVINKENKIIMLKSWNEWGEGNYMEPDIKYGKGYLDALKTVLSDFKK